jgi:hypothetical protein
MSNTLSLVVAGLGGAIAHLVHLVVVAVARVGIAQTALAI